MRLKSASRCLDRKPGGSFVAPSSASTTAAVQAFDSELSQDVRASIVDPPASAKDAYPISGLSFFLIAKDGTDATERLAIRDFTQYIVTAGQDLSEGLDYAASLSRCRITPSLFSARCSRTASQ